MMEDTFYLDISVSKQELSLVASGRTLASYPVSTARNGMGEKKGSECTPGGWHKIKAKIGSAMPKNSVFVGRRPTGEIYSAELGKQFPHRDWILSRILWLVGLEAGKNRYGHVDTGWRYIYIHGTADESDIGTPASHGCIRMNNDDVIDLFARVDTGTKVFIHK